MNATLALLAFPPVETSDIFFRYLQDLQNEDKLNVLKQVIVQARSFAKHLAEEPSTRSDLGTASVCGYFSQALKKVNDTCWFGAKVSVEVLARREAEFLLTYEGERIIADLFAWYRVLENIYSTGSE